MAKRSRGLRSKSRQILRKSPRDRGLPPVTHALRAFDAGQRVAISINSAVHGGMPHTRYQGATGVVAGRRGEAVLVRVMTGSKERELVIRPEHLRPVA